MSVTRPDDQDLPSLEDLNEPAPDFAPKRLSPRKEELALIDICRNWDWTSLAKKMKLTAEEPLRGASISSGRHQAAEMIAQGGTDGKELFHLIAFHIDSFQASRTEEQFQLNEASERIDTPENLQVVFDADLPPDRIHFGLLSLVTTGEAELTRDHMQQLIHRLEIGGLLFVSVDNPDDRWVLEQLRGYEKSVKVREHESGIVYCIEKSRELKKLKDFSCELAYRDCDELVKLVTRPGVFSHRQLDNGARQLLDAVDVYPQARLLDIGCGAGSVALGLAKRDPSAQVHAVDANARGIDCVKRGMILNDLHNITTEVNWTGIYGEPESFDMALANPPYYGDFRIAEKFIQAAVRSLRPGGRLVLVTKQPRWYEANLPRWFVECEIFDSRRYFIASGVKPS